MNREIKFRVWWVREKRMDYKPESSNFVWEGQDFNLAFQEDERNILLQYTGLKDKNGKEIYEGDLLSLGPIFKLGVHPVIFESGTFGIDERGYFHSFMDEEMKTQNIEVVGNIYENTKPPESNPRA